MSNFHDSLGTLRPTAPRPVACIPDRDPSLVSARRECEIRRPDNGNALEIAGLWCSTELRHSGIDQSGRTRQRCATGSTTRFDVHCRSSWRRASRTRGTTAQESSER